MSHIVFPETVVCGLRFVKRQLSSVTTQDELFLDTLMSLITTTLPNILQNEQKYFKPGLRKKIYNRAITPPPLWIIMDKRQLIPR